MYYFFAWFAVIQTIIIILHYPHEAVTLIDNVIKLPAKEELLVFSILFLPVSIFIIVSKHLRLKLLVERHYEINIIIVILAAIPGCYLVWDDTSKTAIVALLAAVLATLGWLTQRHQAIDISRKQHTMAILTQFRNSEIFNRHRLNLLKQYPPGVKPTRGQIDDILQERNKPENFDIKDQKFPVAESLYFIANFWEFVSAAIISGDLDKQLVEETISTVMVSFYEKFRTFIEHPNNLDMDAHGTPHGQVYTNYHLYYNDMKLRNVG
jgi:hypothetical protein